MSATALDLEKHRNLIRKVVWSYARKSIRLQFEDLIAEAYIACLEARSKYNASKGAETTFIWAVISNRMRDILKTELQDESANILCEDVAEVVLAMTTHGPEVGLVAQERWEEIYNNLSLESQTVCQLALQPVRYLSTDTPGKYRKALQSVLLNRGWKKSEVKRRFREIKEALRQ